MMQFEGEYASASSSFYGFAKVNTGTLKGFGGSFNQLISVNGIQTLKSLDYLTKTYNYDGPFTGISFSSTFITIITNDSDNLITGAVYNSASALAVSFPSTTQVPEPSTHVMLLAGLCLITFASRRNKTPSLLY